MPSCFNGRNLLTYKCFVVYMFCFAENLRLSIGLKKEGNIAHVCSNSTINATSGTLYSPNFPELYNSQEDCVTNFSITSAFLIEISFEVFQTVSVSNLNMLNEMCVLDYVEIIAGNKSVRICGNWIGKERLLYFIFITSFISIRFHSNGQNSNQGFVMMWSSTVAHDTEQVMPCKQALFETANTCYEIMTEPEDWLAGHETCRRRGASLAKIEDFHTQAEIETRLFDSKMRFHAVWIGAHDRLFEGDYMWPDRSAIQFHNWFPGWQYLNTNETHSAREPSDDGYSNEDCVEMRKLFSFSGKGTGQTTSFFWNDRNCDEKNPFICQHDKHRGKRSTDQVPLQCDQLVELNDTRSSVIITSPSYPGIYPAYASCHTIVIAPIGKQLHIDFKHFEIEDGKQCEYDNVSLSELPVSNESVTVRCGNWNTKLKLLRWTSKTNKIVIKFQSDNTKQFPGFSLNVSLVHYANLCLDDIISSPDIYGPGGCWVLVDGFKSSTEAEETCASFGAFIASREPENIQFAGDLLNVTDACKSVWLKPGNLSQSLNTSLSVVKNDSECEAVRICGSQKYQGNILLEYKSVVTQVSCSSLNYLLCQRPLKPVQKNGNEVNMTNESGYIYAYNKNGQNYSNNQNLSLQFFAREGFRIMFELAAYDIEYQNFCLYDCIETRGMSVDRKYCGKSTEPVTFISKHNYARILFNTDEDVTAAGFNLSWFSVKSGEAFQTKVQSETEQRIVSVNYPKPFSDTVDNCSYVTVPNGQRLLVEVEEIRLPGKGCDESRFEIFSGSNVIKDFCGGTRSETLTYFSRYALTNDGNITFCLKAPNFERGEGVNMLFTLVPRNSSKLSNSIKLLPNQSIEISSLMFPDWFPDQTTHDIIFRTHIGYQIIIALNFTANQHSQCSLDTLKLNDISLKYGSDNSTLYSCMNLTDDSFNWTEIVYGSILNAIQLVVSGGKQKLGVSTIKFTGKIFSVKGNILTGAVCCKIQEGQGYDLVLFSGQKITNKSLTDALYMNKTRKTEGTFDECDNNTCQNGGSCSATADNRFTCSCLPQYTGLFCQASVCDTDLNPCHKKHGTCRLTNTGFLCDCDSGYWGERCMMNSLICQYKQCSGNGRCVFVNDTETGCLCDELFTGPRCSVSVAEPEEKLTIGQKLLKEPIWIGMIVILNLVFFFCVSYVIRRKCGRKIAKLFPTQTKTANSNSKENSKAEPAVNSFDHRDRNVEKNVHTIILDTPSESTRSQWSAREKVYHEENDNKSAPSTPVVTEDNQEAAMKLFAAYNTRKPDLSPNITSMQSVRNNLTIKARDIMSCGIQGGTVTLNPDAESDNQTKEPVHGMLRSYTISTEIRDFESRISKTKNEAIRKTLSYSGSPVSMRNAGAGISSRSPTTKVNHCYPEIRIINEHNCEEKKLSDSDGNSDMDRPVFKDVSESKTAEITHKIKTADQHDSGYPSTTISTTQDSSQVEEANLKIKQSASERRQLFSSKAKSASFYKICKDDAIPKTNRKDALDSASGKFSFKNSTSGDFPSIESEISVSCKRDQIERYAYSCESDLDKMHRCKGRRRGMVGHTNSYSHHNKKHRRRKKCGCVKHNSFSIENDFRQPYVHLKREHYLPSRLNQSSEHWDGRRHRSCVRAIHSSTESDSCLCSTQEMRCHRRHHIREAFSEQDFRRRHDSAPVKEIDYTPRLEFHSDDSYKSKLMRSFLSDTYRANFRGYSGSEISCDNHAHPKNFLSSPQNSSNSSSRDKSRSSSPRNATLQFPLTIQRKRSDTVVEVVDDNINDLNISSVSTRSSQCFDRPFNSPLSLMDNNVITALDTEKASENEVSSSENRKECYYLDNISNSCSEIKILPDVDYIHRGNDNCLIRTQSSESQKSVKDSQIKPISVVSNVQKDSAYQTQQSSIDKFRRETSIKGSGTPKLRHTDTTDSQEYLNRQEDRVQRHLHQAAQKLALLKRLQTRKSYSKDSAIHTFSEDDLSTDDGESRGSFGLTVKRTSGTLAFQLRETSLSQVKEEHSGVSKDTDSYNTPNNEPLYGSFDKSSSDVVSSAIALTQMSTSFNDTTAGALEETIV